MEDIFTKIYARINKTIGDETEIKLEHLNTEQPQIVYEYKIYKYLQNSFGIWKVYECSKNKKFYNINYGFIRRFIRKQIKSIF